MSAFKQNLRLLVPETEQTPTMAMRWGTVMSDLTVVLDHEENPIPVDTPSLVHLVPGDRVMVDSVGQIRRVSGALTRGGLIPTSVDLNTLTLSGKYWVTANADTSTSRNFPIAVAGALEVEALAEGYAIQTYQTWTTTNGITRKFVRHLYAGTWRDWVEETIWSPWITLTLEGTWSSLSSGTFGVPSFRVGGGVVELAGAANGGTTGTSPALDVATIPTYARPTGDRLLTRRLGTGTGSGDLGDVRASSGFRLYVFAASYSGSWVNFTGLSYRLENTGAR